jgi:hypothetical protein
MLVILISICSIACSKPDTPNPLEDRDVFIFTAYENSTGVWTIVRNNIYEKTKTEIKAVCIFYRFEPNTQSNAGKNACSKNVGEKVSLHAIPKNPSDFAIVRFESDMLMFIEGASGERIYNTYEVLSSKLVSY